MALFVNRNAEPRRLSIIAGRLAAMPSHLKRTSFGFGQAIGRADWLERFRVEKRASLSVS
jgi:hypothetical protein